MPRIISRKSKKNTSKRKIQNGINNRTIFPESYTSLIFGAIVVLIVGILFVFFAKANRETKVSFVSDISEISGGVSEQISKTSSTYTVNAGDDLWSISENVYKDGYSWVAIARANKIVNPSLIYVGTELKIPVIISSSDQGKTVVQKLEQNPQTQNSVIKNNSITRNTYTVVSGDNLWDIAVRAYGDGFRWPEIAKANSLVNPNLIHPGNVFIIPR